MKLKFKNKKEVDLKVKKLNWFGRVIGLMFSRREKAHALLFDFEKPVRVPIHSWFVFFEFYALWLDDKSNVLEIQKVKSWRSFVRPQEKYVRLVEIPLNRKYKTLIERLPRCRED